MPTAIREVRFFAAPTLRAKAAGKMISGHAAIFNVETDLGFFPREGRTRRIPPNACRAV